MQNRKIKLSRLLVDLAAMFMGVTFISVSCSVDRLCHLEVVMKNTLPMELTIMTKDCGLVTSQDSSYNPSQTITIPAQGEVTVVWDYRYQIDYPQYFDDNQCDSMRIVFNDSVQIVFSKEDWNSFNPILMENYEVLDAENSWDGCLRYTFTEEDYQNALERQMTVLNFLHFRAKEEANLKGYTEGTTLKYRSNLNKKAGSDPISALLAEGKI